jgi:hypothetical protein
MKKTIDLNAVNISENDKIYYGADQHWFKSKLHGLSGCGPTTAAQITMYLAAVYPSCSALYGYTLPATKDEFVSHMTEVREFVRPGAMGLTDAGYFASSTAEFAKCRGVDLTYDILPNDTDKEAAFAAVKKAIDDKLMPALLILRNPSIELDDFTWHWMAVTGYDEENGSVFVSTYAKEYEFIFSRVWIQYKPNHADIVILYPPAGT